MVTLLYIQMIEYYIAINDSMTWKNIMINERKTPQINNILCNRVRIQLCNKYYYICIGKELEGNTPKSWYQVSLGSEIIAYLLFSYFLHFQNFLKYACISSILKQSKMITFYNFISTKLCMFYLSKT